MPVQPLEARHKETKRVFSFRFSGDDERHIKARGKLEEWELLYRDSHGVEAPLPQIMVDIILEYGFGKPSPLDTEKRMMNLVLRQLESMEQLLQAIYAKEPTIVTHALQQQQHEDGETVGEDFFNSMLGDFRNDGTDGR